MDGAKMSMLRMHVRDDEPYPMNTNGRSGQIVATSKTSKSQCVNLASIDFIALVSKAGGLQSICVDFSLLSVSSSESPLASTNTKAMLIEIGEGVRMMAMN